jgi:hypothetical protein
VRRLIAGGALGSVGAACEVVPRTDVCVRRGDPLIGAEPDDAAAELVELHEAHGDRAGREICPPSDEPVEVLDRRRLEPELATGELLRTEDERRLQRVELGGV